MKKSIYQHPETEVTILQPSVVVLAGSVPVLPVGVPLSGEGGD